GAHNRGGKLPRARHEFIIAAVGPLASFVLAALFWTVSLSLHGASPLDVLFGSARALRAMTPLTAILAYLTAINLILGAFNLIPAFPLDGGRVFRSIVWGLTRRYVRATFIASIVGQVFGFLMIGFGLVRIIYGDLFGGLWTIFIGWFLAQAAAAARSEHLPPEPVPVAA